MKGKTNKVIIGLVGIWVVLVGLLTTTVYFFHDSYAIDTQSSGFPNTTFTSNYSGSDKINLISEALSGNSSYASKFFNFEAVPSYKTNDNSKPLYSMMKNLNFPTSSERFEITDESPVNISDAGLLYILSHGYNISNSTNTVFSSNKFGTVTDNNIKQYITQMAVFLYLFEKKDSFTSNYCIDTSLGVSACDFYVKDSTTLLTANEVRQIINDASKVTGYNYLSYIIELVDKAKSYQLNNEIKMGLIDASSIEYIIQDDGSSLTTKEIIPIPSVGGENYLNYSLRLEDPNNYGAYLTDKDGNKLTTTSNLTDSFKIHVPLKKNITEMDLSSIKVTLDGNFIKLMGMLYHVTSSDNSLIDANKKQVYSDVTVGYSPIENTSIEFSLKNIVRISKIDATNSQELPGATLEIKNKGDGTIIDTWVSTTSPRYFFLNNGEYTLCEKIAPKGFALNEECIDFTVVDNKSVAVQMKNDKEVEIPDTSSNIAKVLYIIGGFILTIGISMIVTILNNKKYLNY